MIAHNFSLCGGEEIANQQKGGTFETQGYTVHTLVAHRCSWEGSCREIFPDFDLLALFVLMIPTLKVCNLMVG